MGQLGAAAQAVYRSWMSDRIDSFRLSSMNSIGSAHAHRSCALRCFAREHSR